MVAAANDKDHIDVVKPEPVDKHELKTAIVKMVKKGCSPLKYWTVGIIDQWCQSGRQAVPGTAKEKRDAIHELLDECVFTKEEIDLTIIGKKGMATKTMLDETKAKELKYLV